MANKMRRHAAAFTPINRDLFILPLSRDGSPYALRAFGKYSGDPLECFIGGFVGGFGFIGKCGDKVSSKCFRHLLATSATAFHLQSAVVDHFGKEAEDLIWNMVLFDRGCKWAEIVMVGVADDSEWASNIRLDASLDPMGNLNLPWLLDHCRIPTALACLQRNRLS